MAFPSTTDAAAAQRERLARIRANAAALGNQPKDPPAEPPRRPFGGQQPKPFDFGSAIRDLGQQLGAAAGQVGAAMQRSVDPLTFPENAQPADPPKPQAPMQVPDLNFQNEQEQREANRPRSAATLPQLRRDMGPRRWQDNMDFANSPEFDQRSEQIPEGAQLFGSPAGNQSDAEESIGAAYDAQSDAEALRSAERKLEAYKLAVAEWQSRVFEAEDGKPVFVGPPPAYPELTAREKGVLNNGAGISHDEEIGITADETAKTELTDGENALLEQAFVVNTNGDWSHEPEDFEVWLSENFGDVDPEDRADAMRAAIRNIAPTQGPMTYDPTSISVMDSQSGLSRNDPRQQGDLNYVDRDEYGNETVNIPSARGRGARVNVEGATDTGGRGYARRTAGGDAVDLMQGKIPAEYLDENGQLKPEYTDENGNLLPKYQIASPNGRAVDKDESAQFYAQSAGYDLEDMTPAERIGKARKIQEDDERRGRSFDKVFDPAAGENGEWRYTENDASKNRRQSRQAYGRVMRSIERDPRAWNDVFLNPETGEPDVARIEAWVKEQGLFPETMDSEFGTPHDADVQRVKNEMVRRIASAMGRSEAWQQNLRMRGNEQNMRNPMLARQMLMGSIQEAEARGASPQEIARIYAAYGADGSARAEYALGAQQIQADAAVRAAQAGMEPEEPPVGQQMRELDIGVMQPYFDDPTDMNQYKNTLRYVESVIKGEAQQSGMPIPEDDALASQATQRVAQVFLASPQGKNAMQFASANSAQGEFLRTPGISSYLTGFAEAAPERTWIEWLQGSDRTKKENFLNTVMANIGLSDDYLQALEMWFDDWAATVTGG